MAAKFTIKNPSKLLVPGLVVLLVAAAFLVGSLWTKVSMLEKDGVPIKGTTAQQAGTQPSDAQPNPLTPVKADTLNIPQITDKDHVKGDKSAKLTWIEYSDLECPFCKKIHPDLVKMLDEYKGKVRWVYRHFPLDQLHPKADKEAEAVECAGELGGNDKFWQMADKIFEVTPSNNGLNLEDLPKFASQVGLDQGKFKTCLDSGKFTQHVEDDYQGGVKAGVNGTPGNFLLDDKGNAWVIPGAVPYATIKQVIDSALASQ
ncbi:MAG: DsbA family protein [bacterium]|nr:DsbA family protein [bacterium]